MRLSSFPTVYPNAEVDKLLTKRLNIAHRILQQFYHLACQEYEVLSLVEQIYKHVGCGIYSYMVPCETAPSRGWVDGVMNE